ncbi:hypothetical protein F4604DRAFT_1680849 [Suillus subluteus]|nr:hypothetical protein F4604DRAFT_1680849 [Suillus subluteus]
MTGIALVRGIAGVERVAVKIWNYFTLFQDLAMTHMVTVVVWVQRVARITTGRMTRVMLNIILRVTSDRLITQGRGEAREGCVQMDDAVRARWWIKPLSLSIDQQWLVRREVVR